MARLASEDGERKIKTLKRLLLKKKKKKREK